MTPAVVTSASASAIFADDEQPAWRAGRACAVAPRVAPPWTAAFRSDRNRCTAGRSPAITPAATPTTR